VYVYFRYNKEKTVVVGKNEERVAVDYKTLELLKSTATNIITNESVSANHH
jgi:hypothetical protein